MLQTQVNNEYKIFRTNGKLSFYGDEATIISSIEYIIESYSKNKYDHDFSIFLELEPGDILILKDGKYKLDENLNLNTITEMHQT